MEERLGLSYSILHDRGNAAADAWGLTFDLHPELAEIYGSFGIDVPASNGEGGWRLPMPARFVVDKGGVLREAHVHPDYTKRPEPEGTLEVVLSLVGD